MTGPNYGRLTAGLIAAWFTFSFTASALHLFTAEPGRPPLAILLAVTVPIAAFLLWYRASRGFREFVLSLNPRVLTMVHAWRTVGITFLVLYSYHILPGLFALPAGWGDILIGVTAVPVALTLADANHRRSFIFWQILGMTDLVLAIGLGGLGQFIAPEQYLGANGVTAAPMSLLPLSLIPTFAVPVLLLLHIVSIRQAARWGAEVRVAGRTQSVAAFS